MRSKLKLLSGVLLISFAMTSCTVYKASKTPQTVHLAALERNQYEITDDITAEVTLRRILGFIHHPKVKYGAIKERTYYL